MTYSEEPVQYEVDLKPNEPIEIEQQCISCSETGVLRLLLVPDLFLPDTIITSFICKACGYRDQQMDQVDASSAGVEIRCSFKKAEDLRRYVVIPAGTQIQIEAGELGVSLTQKEDSITIIESLIRFVLEKMISQGTMPEYPITEEEMEGLGEYKETAMFLQKSLDTLDLSLTLRDNKGVARVMPAGISLRESTKNLPFEYFTDESVTMVSYPVEEDSADPDEETDRDVATSPDKE
ncbi:hypothetical protein NEDG_01368 [Nematocida displodere]|uniref:Zinc finger ZPR1-type domain-containing protein n=1 Tax=Nematocida displodere TaxID=1805483 RepID=A0A177EBH8_9MICR|nr:hypothetical protein NEDG_01368 [Nematocida displodere]